MVRDGRMGERMVQQRENGGQARRIRDSDSAMRRRPLIATTQVDPGERPIPDPGNLPLMFRITKLASVCATRTPRAGGSDARGG